MVCRISPPVIEFVKLLSGRPLFEGMRTFRWWGIDVDPSLWRGHFDPSSHGLRTDWKSRSCIEQAAHRSINHLIIRLTNHFAVVNQSNKHLVSKSMSCRP